jgi:uncharacterized protein YecT (DUF1311 family)
MTKNIIATLILFCFYPPLSAEEQKHPVDMGYQKCMDASGGVTVNMQDCIGNAYAAWDKQLNASYQRLKAKLSPEGQKALLDAQRKWLAYRDAENKLNTQVLTAVEGGTLHNVLFSEKYMEAVRQRALDFEFYVSNLEPQE